MAKLRRWTALVLALVLVISMIPLTSLAAQEQTHNDITDSVDISEGYFVSNESELFETQVNDLVNYDFGEGETKAFIALKWSLHENLNKVSNGDAFGFTIPEVFGDGGPSVSMITEDNQKLGSVTIDSEGEALAVVEELEEIEGDTDISSGYILFETDLPLGEGSENENSDSLLAQNEEATTTSEEIDFSPLGLTRGGSPTGSANDAPQYGQISLVKFKDVSNGCMGGMALDTAGNVWTWGYNLYGELGIGGTVASVTGVSTAFNYYGGMKRVKYFGDNGIKIVEMCASYETRYALSDTGDVYAWGYGANGAMGIGSSNTTNYTPRKVPGLSNVEHIYVADAYVGYTSVIAQTADGSLYGWGYNGTGHLGLSNTTIAITSPTKINLDASFTDGTRSVEKVAIGRSSAFILDSLGDLWCSGNDANGQLGNGSGTSSKTVFTKMDRSTTGMGRVIDIDASYSALQNISDRIVAADEDGNAWEWGSTYGDGAYPSARIEKHTPQKITLSSTEVANVGYTPVPTSVCASEMVCYFIDQYGRPWGWGTGYYFGFGRDGGYENSNDELVKSTAAQQIPKIIGDGDTQVWDSNEKIPVYLGGGRTQNSYRGYSFDALALHPTIYDEKYMLKDSDGNVMDSEGHTLKYASAASVDGVSGLTIGKYYRTSGGTANKITSPATEAIPALDPTDALWINLALKDVPYISKMDCSLSAYSFIDADGNLFKWGNDGSGAVAWGWDFNSKYDYNGSTISGLYDRYTYEVMYMRGAPTIDNISLTANLDKKVYAEEGGFENPINVSVHMPSSGYNEAMESSVYSDLNELKYVVIPYDTSDPNFTADIGSMSKDDFMALYDAADGSMKGSLVDTPIHSGSTTTDLDFEIDVPVNGRVIIFADNSRYASSDGGTTQEYVNTDAILTSLIVDNIYTPIDMQHEGIGKYADSTTEDIYDPTSDNVEKTNDDSADTGKTLDKSLYGLPLDANGDVIADPRFGYDSVKIVSYEDPSINDVGLPAGVKPYWQFETPQDTLVSMTLDDDTYADGYTHSFYYVQDLDYWTDVDGEKVWDDNNDGFGFRPTSVTLTLKKYERNTSTGAKGDFIEDVESVTFGATENWKFDFGSHKSYEYTYEVVETAIPLYTTTVTYTNQVIGGTTNEDLSGIVVTNTLNLKPIKLNKVDAKGVPITSDVATFVLTNATAGGKVLDSTGVEQNSIQLSTSASDPYIVVPAQKPGSYVLTETKAPAGYNLLTEDIEITVDASGEVTATLGAVDLEEVTLSDTEKDVYLAAFNVINKIASDLPQAGGMGTTFLLIISSIVLLATALMLRRKRAGGVTTSC